MAGDVLEVGDVMRWSAALVEAIQVDERDILVRVTAITREADGTVSLTLTNADAGDGEIRQ